MTDLIAAKVTGVIAAVSAVAGIVLALTDAVAISAITSSAALCMTVVTAYFAHRASIRAEASKKLSEETKKVAEETKKVAEGTHTVVNSRLTEFMEMAKQKFFAEGKLEGGKEAKVISDAAEKARLEAKPKIVESTEGSVKVTSETTTTTKVEPTKEP